MGTWFLYDIVDYGLGLYSSNVLKQLAVGSGDAATTRAVLITQIIGLPGCLLSVYLVPRLGRKETQLLGSCGMLAVYVLLAALLSVPSLSSLPEAAPDLFVTLYGVQLIFDYMGPGATTYIIPGEIFPTAARATCHGLSAASGKLGAAIGSYSFGALIDSGLGLQGTFLVTSGVTLLLLLTTSLFVPRYGQRTLGALEGCDGATAVALLYAPRRGS